MFLLACSPPPASSDAGADATSDGGANDAAAVEPVCPPASGNSTVVGDFNGDGAWDIADVVALSNHLFRGGRGARCTALADFRTDGHLEIDDHGMMRSALIAGSQAVPRFDGRCGATSVWTAGPCVPLALSVRAPQTAMAGRFEARIVVSSPGGVVQGWSASLRAQGCRVLSAALRDTVSADVSDVPPGLRHLGYGVAQAVDGGVVSATELSLSEDITLPPGEHAVATVTVEATVASGCAPCELSLGDGLRWTGQPLTLTVAAGGYAYHPAPRASVTQVCAR
jgi:hypothetical protein